MKSEGKIYECKARGVFRKKSITPFVGDNVRIEIQHDNKGYITEVFDRKNLIKRPPVANIDQVITVISLREPNINYYYLDKYLAILEYENIDCKILLNKIDLYEDEEIDYFLSIYGEVYDVFLLSSLEGHGTDEVKEILNNKVSALSGNSGVGKTTLINSILKINMTTSSISQKTERGRHTTRNIELFEINEDSYIFDTPGFSSITIDDIEDVYDLSPSFREFVEPSKECKFNNCIHINEPACKVKEDVKNEKISKSRYDSYVKMIDEINSRRKY